MLASQPTLHTNQPGHKCRTCWQAAWLHGHRASHRGGSSLLPSLHPQDTSAAQTPSPAAMYIALRAPHLQVGRQQGIWRAQTCAVLLAQVLPQLEAGSHHLAVCVPQQAAEGQVQELHCTQGSHIRHWQPCLCNASLQSTPTAAVDSALTAHG